jgi:hypothetical protein
MLSKTVLHPNPPAPLIAIMHWTFEVVGHYSCPTLEQWELGFMQDLNMTEELRWWHRLAFAFLTWHRKRNLPLRSDAEEKELVSKFNRLVHVHQAAEVAKLQAAGKLKGGPAPRPDPWAETDEAKFLQECHADPDGWEEEAERTLGLLKEGTWGPPVNPGQGIPGSLFEQSVEYFMGEIRAGRPPDPPVGVQGKDGRLMVIDGRKRAEAMRRSGAEGIKALLVMGELTYEQFHQMRRELNQASRKAN